MRLLFIGINYAPEETGNAPYTTALAEHFAGQGHEVTVLTGMPHYPSWRRQPVEGRGLWQREHRNGVEVMRSWHYVPGSQSAARRGLYEASFLLGSLPRLGLARPDAIIGVSPILSGAIMARVAARRFHAPYGLILQDLMGPAAQQSGLGRGRMALAVRGAECWAVEHAESVAIIAEAFRPYVESLGVSADRIVVARNWTHIATPMHDRNETRQRFDLPEGAFVCLHAGNMGYKQDLENVIEAARIAAGRDDGTIFVLLGDGNRCEHLKSLVAEYGLHNVRFIPVQPETDFVALMAAADVLLINQGASVTDMSFPSKLTSYVAADQPIVAAATRDSALARELTESGAAVVVDACEPEQLCDAIKRVAEDELLRFRLKRSVTEYAALFSRERSLHQFERFVNRIAGRTEAATVATSEPQVA